MASKDPSASHELSISRSSLLLSLAAGLWRGKLPQTAMYSIEMGDHSQPATFFVALDLELYTGISPAKLISGFHNEDVPSTALMGEHRANVQIERIHSCVTLFQ